MDIKVFANQEVGPFWGPERGYNRGNFGDLKNILVFVCKSRPNAIIFVILFMKCRLKYAKVKPLGSHLFQPFFKSSI